MSNSVKYLEDFITEPHVFKHNPLWFHKQQLMQTSTGYGKKLATPWMLRIGKRWHRVYVMCFSNCGTSYVVWKGENYVIRNDNPYEAVRIME